MQFGICIRTCWTFQRLLLDTSVSTHFRIPPFSSLITVSGLRIKVCFSANIFGFFFVHACPYIMAIGVSYSQILAPLCYFAPKIIFYFRHVRPHIPKIIATLGSINIKSFVV
jgi:hypothetical protein